MEKLKFKTDINCNGCIAKVTPSLNQVQGILKWDVDITNPLKILTVEASGITGDDIIKIVNQAGYNAQKLRD